MTIPKKSRCRWTWRLAALIPLLLVLCVGLWTLMPLSAWLPHDRVVLSLPFAPKDDAQNLIPMGETIAHANSPHGHPGIDFQWDHRVAIIASVAGKVADISYNDARKDWDVVVRTGVYEVRYKELDEYSSTLKKGGTVEKGQLIGYPCNPKDLPDGNKNHFQLHWELASACLWKDRFCPLGYFDAQSRKRIEAIWARSKNHFKSRFPNICNGYYQDRED